MSIVSERASEQERSKQGGASKRVSGVSERWNGRARGPVLQSVFLAVLDCSGGDGWTLDRRTDPRFVEKQNHFRPE